MVDDHFSRTDLRREYLHAELKRTDLHKDPFEQFSRWFSQALTMQVLDANAMALATASDNRPTVRIVLLKELDKRGLIFFTNYQSTKGKQLAQSPYAAATFFWPSLERQVRFEGSVEKLTDTESDVYFYSRPEDAQISAICSPQSHVIDNRQVLEDRIDHFKKNAKPIVRPANWGGYRLIPSQIEFWQGRKNRLHDRFLYTHVDNHWQIVQLAP